MASNLLILSYEAAEVRPELSSKKDFVEFILFLRINLVTDEVSNSAILDSPRTLSSSVNELRRGFDIIDDNPVLERN